MWSIKTVDAKKNLQAEVPGERMMLHVTAIVTNGTDDVEIPFKIENKDLMDTTLLSIVDRMNKLDETDEATPNGEAYEPPAPVEEVVPTPSPEEVAAQKAQAAWLDALGKLKKARELKAIAVDEGRTISVERQQMIDVLVEFTDTNFLPEYIDLI